MLQISCLNVICEMLWFCRKCHMYYSIAIVVVFFKLAWQAALVSFYLLQCPSVPLLQDMQGYQFILMTNTDILNLLRFNSDRVVFHNDSIIVHMGKRGLFYIRRISDQDVVIFIFISCNVLQFYTINFVLYLVSSC